ncbi:MAG: cytochrome c3 family protein [SAR324 cluster bacterium]|nr:cytochrome c3 family protein [SAR324 cluster bacterium]
MRILILSLVVLFTLFTAVACKEFPGIVSHSIELNDAEHGSKLYSGVKNCTVCHGVSLQGQNGPSCNSCHGVMWNNDNHEVNNSGVMHKAITNDAPTDCGQCHGGTTLKKANIYGKLRPGCYDCHGKVW